MIKKIALILISFLFVLSANCQGEQKTPNIIAESGESVVILQDSSYFTKNLQSVYYIDSISKLPYSGTLLITYGSRGQQSVTVKNGVQDGWSISSHSDTLGTTVIDEIVFIDQENKTKISRHFDVVSKKNLAYIDYFLSHSMKCSIKIRFYENKIKLNANYGLVRAKGKFNNLEELKVFFSNHFLFNELSEASVFKFQQ